MATEHSTEVSRPTQSFVHTLTWMRRHPKLLALEVAWRWTFGIPVLWFVWRWASHLMVTLPWQQTEIQTLSINMLLTDPMKGSVLIANAVDLFFPYVKQFLVVWAVPALLAWCILAAAGRNAILMRMQQGAASRPVTLFWLNLLRMVPMMATAWLWWFLLSVAAEHTVLTGGEPQMMVYVGCALVLTLILFVLWAALGWIFSIAPVLAVTRNLGAFASLKGALQLKKKVRGGLVEINLVMGVVKIALLVLLTVFSATPLPFQAIATPDFLFRWTVGVAILYFLASDFFHAARLAGYLHLLQASE